MRKRKSSLLQRMMAVLLSAVLVTGMVSNAAPMTVLAQEPGTVSGNDSAPEAVAEPQPGTVSGNDAALSEEEQAGIPEEAPAKLAAWTAAAQTAGESAQVMTAAAASDTCGDNVTWTLADGVLTISGTGEMRDYDNVSNLPPWEDHKTDIVSVVIEDGVTSIGTCAFQTCSALTSVTIPGSVTSIGSFAFQACRALTSVTIRDGVESIGGNAFENCCALTSVTIPKSVTKIGEKAFCNCSELATVMVLAETPLTVGRYAFGEGLEAECKFVSQGTQGIHVPEGSVEDYKNAWTALKQYITDAAAPAETHQHDGVTFTAWTATDSLPTDAGNYYLTENVTLTETWTVPNGTTTLCLNGKTISASGTDKYRVITINISATLKLYDCRNTGNITGGKEGGVWNKGTFHMYGGKISGNGRASYGGGVRNSGTFYMYGGEINGNSAFYYGGGVYVDDGIFRMSGGKISGNTNKTGGGVYIYNGTFTVGGGAVISGNTYNGKENNVYLKDGQWIEVDSNLLSGSANIGVTTATAPTEGNPVSVTGHNKGDCSQYFHSDNPAYEIVNANDVVQLTVKTLPDTQPPTGKIEVATGDLTSESWTSFLDKEEITFNLFFKEKKWVSIMSADEGGSGCEGTYYYVSDSALTKAQVEALEADAWTRDCTAILEPEPDRKCVVYAKITDGAGNVTYLSSDGLMFDATPPVINGVTDGETYNTAQIVTVTDAMSGVKSVTVNGAEVTLTDNRFTLRTSDNPQAIVVMDKAGNTTTVTVTVKAQTYAVTVNGGKGSGNYEAGATVTITADTPASGKQFDKWVINGGNVTLTDATSSTTTFTMPAGAVSVTATYKDMAGEHTHRYGDWQHDNTQHWKVCSCGAETGRANHDFGDWITDQAATATEAGTKHRDCQTCGYRQTETIAATGIDPGSGTVTPEVKPGANVPATGISTPTEELKDMLLTEEEKRQVQNGTDIRIVLEVQDAGNAVSGSDQAAIQQALNSFTVGQYLNIDLYKLIGSDRTDITETEKEIRIVITVPDSLKNVDSSKTRTFAVIRVHDGRAELLTDLDNSADTITIGTDRFSTYAIVYKDAANSGGENSGNNDNHGGDDNNGGGNDDGGSGNNGGGNDDGGNGNNGSGNDDGNDNSSQSNSDRNDTKQGSSKDSEPKTGDSAPLEIYATLAMIAGFAYLLLYFADRKRGMTEETKRALVSRLVGWAKRGGRIRKYLALAAIFVLLVYYHSIGKKTESEWKEIYGA